MQKSGKTINEISRKWQHILTAYYRHFWPKFFFFKSQAPSHLGIAIFHQSAKFHEKI